MCVSHKQVPLVCSGCCHKTSQTGWFKNNRNLFLTVLEARSLGASTVGWGPSSGLQVSHIFPWRKEQVSSVGPLLLGHSSSRALPSWPYFSSVQSLSHVLLFATPWTASHQASLSITNSWSSPKPMSIESVMPSNHLILCHPLLLLPSIFPSIRVFSNEVTSFDAT